MLDLLKRFALTAALTAGLFAMPACVSVDAEDDLDDDAEIQIDRDGDDIDVEIDD